MICIYTHLYAFASLGGVFPLSSPLNIYHIFFSVCLISLCSLPAAVCSVAAVPFVLSPSGTPLKLPGGLPSCLLCLVVLWWLPLLVRYQAQNGVTVWADAACICPRPDPLLPMCCRVFRRLIRVLSRGFRPSVRGLSCLLPCVVWWQ